MGLPNVMIQKLATLSPRQLNYFVASGGISEHYSPHTILTSRHVDCAKQFAIPFGAYVHGCTDNTSTNTMAPQTLDCVYLGATSNLQGGHKPLDLSLGKVITRPRVIKLPMTDLVVCAVNAMAKADGVKFMKFSGCDGHTFESDNWFP